MRCLIFPEGDVMVMVVIICVYSKTWLSFGEWQMLGVPKSAPTSGNYRGRAGEQERIRRHIDGLHVMMGCSRFLAPVISPKSDYNREMGPE